MNERETKTGSRNGVKKPFPSQPLPTFPLVAQPSVSNEVHAELARMEAEVRCMQEQTKLEVMKINGMVAAATSAMPLLDRLTGDPVKLTAALTDLVLQRGVDIAEQLVEITIDDES